MRKWMIAAGLFISLTMVAQTALPVAEWKGADENKPIIFYLTGDGGWNTFSTSLVKGFSKEGYGVIGLNTRSYFWKKKTPETAAADISRLIVSYQQKWKQAHIILIGFSFGADVLPFIQTRLSKEVYSSVVSSVLLSPSPKTDFEIHVLGMLGFGGKNGRSVTDEINKLTNPVHLLFGSDEHDFPTSKLKGKNIETLILKGGHHYDGDAGNLSNTIMQRLPKK